MREPLTFGSLFTGIGGLDLGLERAGMRCAWQVEIDDYATRVLTKHWPDVPRYRNIRDIDFTRVRPVDVLAGGFPCQDLSLAASAPRSGLTGARSGLWYEFARAIREVRPRYVLVENVADLLSLGIGDVLGCLAALGYDAEWSVLSACALGAPHTRERLFIVAYAAGQRGRRVWEQDAGDSPAGGAASAIRPRDQCAAARPGACPGQWAIEPAVGRVAYGVPHRVDRLRGLGNAVMPQVAEAIGHLIEQHRIMEER